MTTSSTICLPAHILDAHITPRAREVLMLLASQTSAAEPAPWICQKTIAARLRCSVATVARSIQKLVEAKLIAETGRLHEGKYKFYHVRWSGDENLKLVSKKITKPVRKVSREISPPLKKGVGGFFSDCSSENPPSPLFQRGNVEPPTSPSPSTISPTTFTSDSRIAYYAEVARQKYLENRRRYQAELLSLR